MWMRFTWRRGGWFFNNKWLKLKSLNFLQNEYLLYLFMLSCTCCISSCLPQKKGHSKMNFSFNGGYMIWSIIFHMSRSTFTEIKWSLQPTRSVSSWLTLLEIVMVLPAASRDVLVLEIVLHRHNSRGTWSWRAGASYGANNSPVFLVDYIRMMSNFSCGSSITSEHLIFSTILVCT